MIYSEPDPSRQTKIASRLNGELTVPHCREAMVWHYTDSSVRHFQTPNIRYWWKHSGYALAVLLYCADYTAEAQYQFLEFFAKLVAPSLGISLNGSIQSCWSSFMTDDGNPIELSWDWGDGRSSPKIRYSIEPVGPEAGTTKDPHNQHAGSEFHQCLVDWLPSAKLEWYNHFKLYFDCHRSLRMEGDLAEIFYAFDLESRGTTAKAYFFPSSTAKAKCQSNLESIVHAISTAPLCRQDKLQALRLFQEFASEPTNKSLELDMLAIDLIKPEESRLKIYFRSRETSFASVIHAMTLGGRIPLSKMEQGIENLWFLWNTLFETTHQPDSPLPLVSHRTAGILYNVAFKLGSRVPIVKVYLPVRHYSASDEKIIRGLDEYLQAHQGGAYMPNYKRAINCLFSQNEIRVGRGVQNYIGCSILTNGSLRIVSYINPQTEKLSTNANK